MYGHAVQLKHVQSEMYLACLSSCSSNDKLAFDVGVQETNEGLTQSGNLNLSLEVLQEKRVGGPFILLQNRDQKEKKCASVMTSFWFQWPPKDI